MYSCKSGEKRTVNQVGKTHFGKWFLYRTSEKEDTWKKPVVDDEQGIIVADSYIMLLRTNISLYEKVYCLSFTGAAYWLKEHYESIYGNADEMKFDNVQCAKDQIDHFIVKLDKLLVFM